MKTYLAFYNSLLALGWASLLSYYFFNGCQLDTETLNLLTICQFAAILEVVHAALKWVKTPVLTAAKQIASRIFVVVLLYYILPESYLSWQGITGLHLIMVAWSLTEIVRYSFYFFNLIEQEKKVLVWLRYTLFLVLYPMGVLGEILIILSLANQSDFAWSAGNIALYAVIGLYPIFFPGMYGHMLKQRKKKLG